jgi:copper chaperone CopZ
MTCSACVGRITRSLRRVDGVSKVKVDLRHEMVTVGRDPGRASDAALAAAVSEAGYEADLEAAAVVATVVAHGPLDRLFRRSRRARSEHE